MRNGFSLLLFACTMTMYSSNDVLLLLCSYYTLCRCECSTTTVCCRGVYYRIIVTLGRFSVSYIYIFCVGTILLQPVIATTQDDGDIDTYRRVSVYIYTVAHLGRILVVFVCFVTLMMVNGLGFEALFSYLSGEVLLYCTATVVHLALLRLLIFVLPCFALFFFLPAVVRSRKKISTSYAVLYLIPGKKKRPVCSTAF